MLAGMGFMAFVAPRQARALTRMAGAPATKGPLARGYRNSLRSCPHARLVAGRCRQRRGVALVAVLQVLSSNSAAVMQTNLKRMWRIGHGQAGHTVRRPCCFLFSLKGISPPVGFMGMLMLVTNAFPAGYTQTVFAAP